ncbi:MAG: hypothetical protein ACFFAZ_11665 [Promethearchaeota archaeon]
MSDELNFKIIVLHLSAIALVLFYLLYTPWTALSAYATVMGAEIWAYYAAILLGMLFPLYYAMGKENMAWLVLGLAIIINSIVWLFVEVTAAAEVLLILSIGILLFLGSILERRTDEGELVKSLFQTSRGLFIVLAAGFYANWALNDFVGPLSINHIMPPFIYMGGGLFAIFGIVLFANGLFKLLKMFTGETNSRLFDNLAKVSYVLMVIVFLLGITYNVTTYVFLNAWGAVSFPTSIDFFADISAVGNSSLGAILLIILYICGMYRIVERSGR